MVVIPDSEQVVLGGGKTRRGTTSWMDPDPEP
jgi:hypothetical protein